MLLIPGNKLNLFRYSTKSRVSNLRPNQLFPTSHLASNEEDKENDPQPIAGSSQQQTLMPPATQPQPTPSADEQLLTFECDGVTYFIDNNGVSHPMKSHPIVAQLTVTEPAEVILAQSSNSFEDLFGDCGVQFENDVEPSCSMEASSARSMETSSISCMETPVQGQSSSSTSNLGSNITVLRVS